MGLAIILIPGGFEVETSYSTVIDFYAAFALYVSDNHPMPAPQELKLTEITSRSSGGSSSHSCYGCARSDPRLHSALCS